MSKTIIPVLLAALLLTAPASAQLVTDLAIAPVVAHTDGLHGTQWVTDLTIFNPMVYEISVGVQFHLADRHNSPSDFYRSIVVVGARETVMIADLLPNLYGIEGNTKGWLLLIARPPFLPNPDGTMFHATARIYNTGGADGTFGQTVSSLVPAANVGWSPSYITGVRNDDSYRSNLGLVALSTAIDVHYRILAGDGSVAAEGVKEVKQYSMSQWSFEELAVGSVDGPLSVELWLDPDDATPDPCAVEFAVAFYAYVSKVDNLTGDAEFLTAVPVMPYICELSPFNGRFAGEATFPESDVCLALTGAPWQTLSSSVGTMSHFGRTELSTAHCSTLDGSAAVAGEATFTVENGDQLRATYTAVTVAPPPLIVQEIDFVVVGGTGRFENATGWLRGVAHVTFEGYDDPSWPIEFAIAGSVAY